MTTPGIRRPDTTADLGITPVERTRTGRRLGAPWAAAVIVLVAVTLTFGVSATVSAQPITNSESTVPTFSKVFTPDNIGPGSVSMLVFTITNGETTPVTSLAFTDILPGAVTIADPANGSTTCLEGVVSAPDGGGTISLTGGRLGGSDAVCTVNVNVTSGTVGTHTNTSGDLTSSAGNSGTATDDLMVLATLPGFTKSFSPSSVPLGGRSTLTFTMDNTVMGAAAAKDLRFTDNLPAGMVIADPANAATTCSGPVGTTFTATAGTSVVFLQTIGSLPTAPSLAAGAGATCTVTVDVTATATGMLDNVTSTLEIDIGVDPIPIPEAGKASATLDVTVTPLSLTKSFTDDPVPPGGTVTLDFTITNGSRDFSATGVNFTDALAAALPGLTFASLTSNSCGGSVAGAGTTGITFTGGTVGAESSCTISVSLTVPGGAGLGSHTNTTGAVGGTVDGMGLTGNVASDKLFVDPAPRVTKTFLDNPVGAGGTTRLEFTITNTSQTSGATGITFSDEFDSVLPTAFLEPADGSACGPSDFTFTPLFNPAPPGRARSPRSHASDGTPRARSLGARV